MLAHRTGLEYLYQWYLYYIRNGGYKDTGIQLHFKVEREGL